MGIFPGDENDEVDSAMRSLDAASHRILNAARDRILNTLKCRVLDAARSSIKRGSSILGAVSWTTQGTVS